MTATARSDLKVRVQSCRRWITLCAALASTALPVRAQNVGVSPFVTLTSEAEERIRLNQLTSTLPKDWFLIRSASRLTSRVDSVAAWRILTPELRATHNSSLPFSLNDGALWAGRGWSEAATFGFAARFPNVRLIVAPTFVSEENKEFQVIPYNRDAIPPRSIWADPFHPLPESIDLPRRFGDQRRQRLDLGQSTVAIDADHVSFGASNENLWWGPAFRNAILLSANASGFPHAFVETRRPLRTDFGTFDAQMVLGQLRESDYFDLDASNDTRSLSGLVFTWSPPSAEGLTLGFGRIVMASRSSRAFPISASFDVFRSVGHSIVDTSSRVYDSGREQIFSLFGRWVFPTAGFEAYGEWARFEEPTSLRDLMEFPGHSQGYTLGFQWARPLAVQRTFQLQAEASYLEPDPSLRVRPVAISYTSHAVPQGFTNRGKTLGAAIGPGASSQWLAGDVFARTWRAGAYLERIRWDNGVLFEPIIPQFKRQDITLLAGLRGSMSWRGVNLLVDFAHAARFYYLFQAYTVDETRVAGIDLINNTLSVTISSAPWHR